jgi:hypothetical protein
MPAKGQAKTLVHYAQPWHLRSRKSAEEQDATGPERATERRCQRPQRRFQYVRDYEAEMGTPMVGILSAEVNFNLMGVQNRVRTSARQRSPIDVSTDDETRATGPRDPGE